MEVSHVSRGVYPPSFCQWRMLLAIVVVAQLSVLLMGLGRTQGISWQWLSLVSSYALCLALFCAMTVCIIRAWVQRLSSRDAWLVSWLAALLAAFSFSYATGVIGSVLGAGPGRYGLAPFMLKSVIAVGLVHAALLRYLFIRSQWKAELIAQADARVQALQARIRPHFLFNSLNTIASLVTDNPRAAERATEDLADLFRGSMRRADSLIPLAEELALARKYLDMEQRRLGDRLEVTWDVESLPGEISVQPLLLQPLLENAVAHGIQPRVDGGTVKVIGKSGPDQVIITISNEIPDTAVEVSRPDDHGMALVNIRRRLELAHGDRASLLTSQDDTHYYAVLTLPAADG
ncbi:MAG: histidine kinase [Xanthomonadales bacterium]|nr:histidine kinase [Xanthomonadales bacterium]